MRDTTIDVEALYAHIVSMPSWLTIENSVGDILSVDSIILDDEVLTCYPTVANYGDELTGSIVLANNTGDTATMTCIHAAPYMPVGVLVRKGTTETFTITGYDDTEYIGSDQLTFNLFTNITTNVWKSFLVADAADNILYYGAGYPDGMRILNSGAGLIIVTLSRNLVAGDVITMVIGNDI
jgi:hypothetical protein